MTKSPRRKRLNAPVFNLLMIVGTTRDAVIIHNQMISAVENFHQLYQQADGDGLEKADLLRAMLLFACSGMDAVIKQLIKDTLADVIARDQGAHQQFHKYVERRLRKGGAADEQRAPPTADLSLLAELIIAPAPKNLMIDYLKRHLTDESLQSRDQLLKVAAFFALTKEEVLDAESETRKAFLARNQITHEMDVDLATGEIRRARSYKDMVRACENILAISRCFIEGAQKRLAQDIIHNAAPINGAALL